MPKASKFSPDEGLTIYDLKDNDAVHWANNTVLGAHNLFNSYGKTSSGAGITVTRNSDGSVSMSAGTASVEVNYPASEYTYRDGHSENLENFIGGKSYRISYGDTPIPNLRIQVFYKTFGSSWNELLTSTNSKVTFTMPNDVVELWIRLNIEKGKEVSANTLYFMVCLESDTDDTFKAYSMSNRDLTNRVIQSVENVLSTFKSEVVVNGSNITNVEWARKIRYGNILIFQARLNKAASTNIWTSIQCPLTFPETFLENTIFTFNSPESGGTGTFDKSNKNVSFRYGLVDNTTYVDMQMIAIIIP